VSNILSIDPGLAVKGGTGWALWSDRVLVAAGLATARGILLPKRIAEIEAIIKFERAGRLIHEVVIEKMQSYTLDKQKGDQNDLIDLSLLGGRLSALAEDPENVTFVAPATWKGQVPKGIVEKRARAVLTPNELQAFERGVTGVAKSAQHNVWDAVGIGLWRLSRGWR